MRLSEKRELRRHASGWSMRRLTQRPFLAYPCPPSRDRHRCSAKSHLSTARRLGVRVKPSITPPSLVSRAISNYIELFSSFARPTPQSRSAVSPQAGDNVMQNKLARLVVMSLVYGLPPAFGAATSTFAGTTEPQELPTASPQISVATSTSQSPPSHGKSVRGNSAPNCEGQSPSNASVTILLSRLVRSSAIVRGVQCTIPPIPDKSLLVEEFHP
jgi:hypothetical protein